MFFVTQSPKDIPADALGQLGHRVQHALRAFTPDDDKALKAAARTFPRTPFYDHAETSGPGRRWSRSCGRTARRRRRSRRR